MPKVRLSNREIIERVKEWQRTGHVHPLTCGRNSSHPILIPQLRFGNRVVLFCTECSYVQEHIPEAVLKGVPPMPAFGFSEKSLRGVVQDIEKLGKEGRKMAKEAVTVTISKHAWQALLRGERVAALRVFSEDELLHHQFGKDPEEFIIKVKITPVTD